MIAKPPRPLPELLDDPATALRRRKSVELRRVDQHLAFRVLDVGGVLVDLAVRRPDDLPDREVERRREVEVALVVRGDGHDRPGPVVGQHVVGDVDGQPLAVHRVDGVQAGETPVFSVAAARSAVFFTPARRT